MKLKIIGLKEASASTVNWQDHRCYTQIFFDRGTGRVWTVDHMSHEEWTEYHDPSVILVCGTSRHMSPKAIRAAIERALEGRGFGC